MKREPSIHLYKKHLVLVLEEVLEELELDKEELINLASKILNSGKKYSLTHRQLKVDNAKLLKSTSKVVLSNRDDAGVFASLLNMVRKQRKHRGISLIKVGAKDWLMVKEIASLAITFCQDFNLKREEGFKSYINLALDKMNDKFALAKFNNLHQSICDDYDSIEKIKLDMTPNLTISLKNIYEKYLGEKGIIRDYSQEPSKYLNFLKAKEEVIKYRVTNEIYIKAQFKGFEWCNSYPDPSQLIGKGAIDRLNRYLVENKIKPQEINQEEKINEAAKWLKEKWAKNKPK